MSHMLDATERTRGILEYVNTLENKVRRYQATGRRFNVYVFLSGVGLGSAVILFFWITKH